METNRRLGQIHILKGRLNMTEVDYRLWMEVNYGVRSAKDLDEAQQNHFIRFLSAALKERQSNSNSPASKHKPYHTLEDKVRALWIDMGKSGFIRNASEQNLNKWIENRFKVASINWLSLRELGEAVEALKQWRNRELRKREKENEKN